MPLPIPSSAPSHVSCLRYANYSNAALRHFNSLNYQKLIGNLELVCRMSEGVWRQEERRESHHTVGSKKKDGTIRLAWMLVKSMP